MPAKQRLDLSTFDGRLLDGLEFCRKVYVFFDQVRREPEGISNLRLQRTIAERRLINELIPIARYVQARYNEGRRIKVRWFSGSQPYDAILLFSGSHVEHTSAPRKLVLEVTTSVHQNAHLARKYLDEHGMSFGVKGTSRDKKTGQIVSAPYAFTNDELARDLAQQILYRLKSKSEKRYPPGTVLIVNCIANTLMLDEEWNDAVGEVTKAQAHLGFREVFLIETVGSHSATLYGDRNRRRGRRPK